MTSFTVQGSFISKFYSVPKFVSVFFFEIILFAPTEEKITTGVCITSFLFSVFRMNQN